MNPRLAARPLDPKRRVPIPFAQELFPDGSADFRSLNQDRVIECGREGLCGLCGQSLAGAMVALVGGPQAAKYRSYSDPPMHVECAEDAMTLCPHIARPLVARREPSATAAQPDAFEAGKPKRWVMLIADRFQMSMQPASDGLGQRGYTPLFKVPVPEEMRVWKYEDGKAVEVVKA